MTTKNNKTAFLPVASESKIQADCFIWFNNTYPDLRGLLYHVPNGEHRDYRTASKLKAMGVVSGVPDMVFHYMGRTWFFEVKDEKGKVSKSQDAIHSKYREHGFIVWITRSLESFQNTVKSIISDKSDPRKIGLDQPDYYYRHKIYDFLYMQLGHNDIFIIDENVDPDHKIKFINFVKDFIRYRFDEMAGFELAFTSDYEALYKRIDGKEYEPIYYKGKSIEQ